MNVLLKYKKVKILITNADGDITLITSRLDELNDLNSAVIEFYKNLLTATNSDIEKIERQRTTFSEAKEELGIIGIPFDNIEAELYALDKKLVFEVLEIHGNSGKQNAKKDKTAESQIQMRVLTSRKSAFVKQAQREDKKLTEWILEKCEKGLDDDLSSL